MTKLSRKTGILVLDKFDRQLLDELQRNGRATFASLSTKVNLSRSACCDRTKRLKRAGYILSFRAILDADRLDAGLTVFIQVRLDQTTPGAMQSFKNAIKEAPEIMECYMVAGGSDYLLKVRVRNMSEYRRFLGTSLLILQGVKESRSYTVLEAIKHTMDVNTLA